MKSEQETISQIRLLKEIKPDAEWVSLAKMRIMGQVEVGQRQPFITLVSRFLFQYKVAVAGLLLVAVSGGTMALAQNALPGEPLYSLKRATENGLAVITGQDKTPAANLRLAAKRLEEINLISQRNMVKNLSAAFYEYKNAKAEAKKEVAALVKQNPSKAGEIVKEAGSAMKIIDDKERMVYGVLGLEPNATGTDDGAEAASDKEIIESLVEYFKKNTTLSEEQSKDLEQVKALYGAGSYGPAVDYYLNSSLNK